VLFTDYYWVIKSKKIVGHVARMGERERDFGSLDTIRERKGILGMPVRRGKLNIKVGLKEIRYNTDWL
jgi:hypothetical protein